ncbi:hypothetical protein BC829DRAFT_399037 [Chytridium lagenaria]|nr:hypothetical protein BC829DRAFT_399037 [Chytridium lagenaria]
MAIDSNFIKFGTPALILLTLILSIVSTTGAWWTLNYNEASYSLGLFSYTACLDGTCVSGSINQNDLNGCSSGRAACGQFQGTRGMMVVANILGFVAIATSAFLFWKGKDAPKFVSFALISSTFLVTFFVFVAMCLGASFSTSTINVKYGYGSGFIVSVVTWIVGAVATVGTVLFYKTTVA